MANLQRSALRVIGALAGLATVAGFSGWWPCELFGHFRVQYAVLLATAAVTLAVMRRAREAMLALAAALVNLALIAGFYVPDRAAASAVPAGPQVRAMLINLQTSNTAYERVRRLIRDEQPDVVMMVELGHEWFRQLRLEQTHPFSEYLLRDDNFGIGVFSRFPIRSSDIIYAGAAHVPSVVASVTVGNRPLTFIGTHPWSPVTPRRTALRDDQLEAVATVAAQHAGAVMVLADLNTTSWSPVFRRILRRAGLRDSRVGFGVQPTWPTFLPLLAVPIDHCLVSPEIAVRRRWLGPAVGSDHRPVLVDVSLPPA